MTVIITGAGGLLGRPLAAEARRAGYRVIGVGRAARPPSGLECDRWIAGDLADPRARECDWQIFKNAAVFHLAADTAIYEPGRDYFRDNVATTETACAIAQRTGGRLVFFSSSAVYSGPRTCRPVAALAETDETNPTTLYGSSKRVAEETVHRAGVDAVVLRIFGVLSDRLPVMPDRGNLVQAIHRSWRTDSEVVVQLDADGQPAVRDYVLDGDICRCALAALTWALPAAGPLVINVSTGVGTSTLEMVETVRALTGKPIPVRVESSPMKTNPVMVGDPTELRKRHKSAPENRVRSFWAQLFSTRGPAR